LYRSSVDSDDPISALKRDFDGRAAIFLENMLFRIIVDISQCMLYYPFVCQVVGDEKELRQLAFYTGGMLPIGKFIFLTGIKAQIRNMKPGKTG
jgi:hypothetical protein